MTRVRLALICAAAAAFALAACGSSPSYAEGAKRASKARGPVAERYWDVMAAVYPSISPGDDSGRGYFDVCPPGAPDYHQVAYDIRVHIVPRDRGLTTAQFVSQTEQVLRAQGWGPFTPYRGDRGYLSVSPGDISVGATKKGYQVYLQQLPAKSSGVVQLTVGGSCVEVGTSFANELPQLYDEYPVADLSARPMPTQPLRTP